MDADEIAHILDRANDLLEAGQPAETLRCLAQIQNTPLDDEDRIEAATLRAWALSEMGHHEAALQVIETLLDAYPDSSRLHAARGIVLSNADELDEAQIELEQAHALDGEDEVTLANLALVCEKLRDYEVAATLYDRALDMGADIDWTLQRKAAVQTELGRYAEARGTLKRYLSLVPEDAAQWVALGILFSDDEDYDQALECYKRAANAEPDSAWLHLNWGVTAVRARRFDVADEQLDELRRCAPGSSRPELLKAFMAEERGKLEEADKAYQSALRGLDDSNEEDVSYVLEMAIDFYARRQRREMCDDLLARAYAANACTVELCEAYREALGRQHEQAMWFSLMVEADYRTGLLEVPDRDSLGDGSPTRFLRNYQVVATDRDEAVAILLDFLRLVGEKNARIREFVNDEPIEDTFAGVYEVERRALVFGE